MRKLSLAVAVAALGLNVISFSARLREPCE
jgi:hypothetical protein